MGGLVKERLEDLPEGRSARNRPSPLCGAAGRGLRAGQIPKGFGRRSVLEIVAGDAVTKYRTVYTVRFQDAIYVLHAFQKKSKKGIATPHKDIELIHKRLLDAEQDYKRRQN